MEEYDYHNKILKKVKKQLKKNKQVFYVLNTLNLESSELDGIIWNKDFVYRYFLNPPNTKISRIKIPNEDIFNKESYVQEEYYAREVIENWDLVLIEKRQKSLIYNSDYYCIASRVTISNGNIIIDNVHFKKFSPPSDWQMPDGYYHF